MMLIEAAIFSRDKRFYQLRRHLLQSDGDAALFAILRNKLAVRAINLHRDLQAHIL